MDFHVLKTWPRFFDAVDSGAKTWEVRNNDRKFRLGDVLELREYEPSSGTFTGRRCRRRVTHIESLAAIGLGGYVGMSIEVVDAPL